MVAVLRVVAAALLMVGCFGPDLPANLRCSDGRCPSGFVCDDGFCRRALSPVDAAVDVVDAAGVDAEPIDARVCGAASFRNGEGGYAGTVDTVIREDSDDNPAGDQDFIEWDNDANGLLVGLIRFDEVFGSAAGQVPPGAEITAAALEVVMLNDSAAPAGSVHEALVAWDEETTFNTFGGSDGLDPGDVGARLADAPIQSGPAVLDLTASVGEASAAAAAGQEFGGWAFVPAEDNGDGAAFISSEGAAAARPRLIVEFCR